MHIIVTHANADFDAVASLLGVWCLDQTALPVLPNRLNRNVRDFVTLYQNQLPFIHHNELPREPINQVTVVDSQQLPRLKGLAESVTWHVIDHHELHQSLPEGTTVTLSETGANATQLVEQICQAGRLLSPLEATLLMLGIYEDTGALTYTNTTTRDLKAAAWLLDKQANLDILRQYLNYAMSDEQKALFDQITERLETHTIHGHTIMIGLATVAHYVEEISSLTHQLRDLYHPDALFILVEMKDHVQMVARSTTDAVDVAQVAEFFGGGGHPRAAAALIKQEPLSEARRQLLRLLQLEVKPAVRVAQIMSHGVRSLTPTDTVRHAAKMMDRYGHEGFPVIDPASHRVVGILSRREIDKARRHRLEGASISQFMVKGEFYVTPTDAVEAVQKLMVEQQIGQVPVVEFGPNQTGTTGRVIGVVTRTDLINLWGMAREHISHRPNLSQPLAKALAPSLLALLREAGERATGQGDTLYIVGGFVRDLLLTMQAEDEPEQQAKTSPRFDLDLVVEGDAIALADRLCAAHGGRVHSHKRFGTAKWMLASPIPFAPNGGNNHATLASLDFVTARTEFYSHPTALPEVEQSSVRQDLHRRDFTINTLALRLTPEHFGELLDFYGGQTDLEAGLIRVLHSLSFVEDPTRMLRATRLLARLDFDLETRTAELLTNALDLLEQVSGERVMHELALIFQEEEPAKALQQADQLGILAAIHPDLTVDAWLTDCLARLYGSLSGTPWAGQAPQPIHALGLLLFWLARDEQTALADRLNLTTRERRVLRQVHTLRSQQTLLTNTERASELYHLLAPTSDEARLIAWLALQPEPAAAQIARFQRDLKGVSPLIDGTYLKAEFALPPGPIYRDLLDALRDARLDGQVQSLAEERALVEAWVKRGEAGE